MVPNVKILPRDIRRIRKKLGLTQAEAGELLGGGPRAFTKYENGTIRPTAATANILRLLDANPSTLITLTGAKVVPIESEGARPFEVTGKHIAALSPRKLALLVRRLLDTEALSGDLPMDGIHVAANITAADGGEDARIQWEGGPARTKFLPNRLSQFQIKAGSISPGEAGANVLTPSGDVKPMVRDALEKGGCYIMLCGRSYENKLIKTRVERIRQSLSKGGLAIGPEYVQFRDADQIASWVNVLPPVAAWVLEQTQPGIVGPFKDWIHWAGRFDGSPWVTDPRLPGFRNRLRSLVGKSRGVARVVGLSGVGKSRLVHEALGPDDEEGPVPLLTDLVLHAVESEAGTVAVKSITQTLVDSGSRAIVVVDRCPLASHQDLAAMVRRTESRVSLVTIDHEVPSSTRRDDGLLLIEQASDAVVEKMILQIVPDIASEDHRRLLKFARGYPQMAILLGQAWLNEMPIAAATDDELVDRILLGRKPFDEPLLKDAGMIIGAFRLLGFYAGLDDLSHVAPLTRGRTIEDLRAAFYDLSARGVVQKHGRLISLQPRPLAMALAERQWRLWGHTRWDEVLTGMLPETLRQNAADQLKMLNTGPIAPQVARHVARRNGPLASLDAFNKKGAAGVIRALSEIDAEAVVGLLEHVLGPLSIQEIRSIGGDLRRDLVNALKNISFIESTFERGALLLLKLAVAENEKWADNSTRQFAALFPVFSSNTAAPAAARLRLFDELLHTNDAQQIPIVVDALIAASNIDSISRIVGPEIHGSRPTIEAWTPKYWNEAWEYVTACVDRLTTLALRDDVVGAQARDGVAQQFRTFINGNQLDPIERWIAKVSTVHPYWPAAIDALGNVLHFNLSDLKPGEEIRIRKLIAVLSPQDMVSRVRSIVTEMPWDYPVDEKLDFQEREKRQVEAVRTLANELLLQSDRLSSMIGSLCEGEQRMSVPFGQAIAELSEDPLFWERSIQDAYSMVADGKLNYGLIVGFYTGLSSRHPVAVDAFKREAVHSGIFAPMLPALCLRLGINAADVLMICEAVLKGTLLPESISCWTMGGVFSKLSTHSAAPLFDHLLALEGIGYSVALDIMGMFVFGQLHRLDDLRPQLMLAVDRIGNRPTRRGAPMDSHHFQEMMGWLLSKGRNDVDARTAAGKLATHLAADPDGNARDLIKPLLPRMLEHFGPIVWPPFGNAIVRDRVTAWRMESVFNDGFSTANNKQRMISRVPEDILFAWAHASPHAGPAFLARVLPILTARVKGEDCALHPLTKRLLDEFGDREDVRNGLVQNMHSFGWWGSLTAYYALYSEPLRSLLEHPIGAVRRWADVTHTHMRERVEAARNDDDEQNAQWDA